MTLSNYEINPIITWHVNCFIKVAPVPNQLPTFALTDAKRYVSVVTLLM